MNFFLNKISIFIAFAPFSLGLGYELSDDSKPQDGVPKGKVTKHQFTNSKVYPGTVRDYWIYVPHQYDKSKPACLMVFQDGVWYQSLSGHTRAPIVFDNLI
ncbi:MAG: esterase family protein, partial [Verrucomicrobiales bacterium]|nr:esterase family protein [Verrucomicrobiales bacterium]